MLITSLPFQQIDTFMRPMTTEGRQTVIMGKENFPLDISERETLHAIIKKHPELGKTSQKRQIGGKMESCICICISRLSPLKFGPKFNKVSLKVNCMKRRVLAAVVIR